jgi:hypothetical protein
MFVLDSLVLEIFLANTGGGCKMADQCSNCTARGDIKKCNKEKDCSIKESWYAIEAKEVIQELWRQLKEAKADASSSDMGDGGIYAYAMFKDD